MSGTTFRFALFLYYSTAVSPFKVFYLKMKLPGSASTFKMKNERINYTQVVWEITRLLQDAESLEEALRTSLGEVVKAV